jgi:hypothetical protein
MAEKSKRRKFYAAGTGRIGAPSGGLAMSIQRYRIRDSTIAMFQEGEVHLARTVSAGTIVELPGESPLDGDRLVEVVWNGRSVLMFTQDLRSRAELIA